MIDAIGLLEGPLVDLCRHIWVVTAPPEQQVARLVATRGLTEDEAWLRVRAQRPQAEKVARADCVFDNSGSRDGAARAGGCRLGRVVRRDGPITRRT